MRSKGDWLDAGLTLLAESGPRGLRLDVVCQAMGATKGSFYHHFSDIKAFRHEVAAHYEAMGTTRYVDEAEAIADQGVMAQIKALRSAAYDEALSEREMMLERAFRAWATQDPDVAVITQRMDEVRIGYVTELFTKAGVADAEDHATLVYLTLIGGHYVMPPLSAQRIAELTDKVIRTVIDL